MTMAFITFDGQVPLAVLISSTSVSCKNTLAKDVHNISALSISVVARTDCPWSLTWINSPMSSVILVLLLTYFQNFFGLALQHEEILWYSWLRICLVSLVTALRSCLYLNNLVGSLVSIYLFQARCFCLIKLRSSLDRGLDQLLFFQSSKLLVLGMNYFRKYDRYHRNSNGNPEVFDQDELKESVHRRLQQRPTENGNMGVKTTILPFPVVDRCCRQLVTVFFQARPQICSWNFDTKCHIPEIKNISGFGGLLAGVPQFQLDRLQSVLNTAARLLVGAKKHDHIRHVLRDRLHWLRVPQRVQFKLCLLTFKALHGLAPSYIADLCRPVTSVGSRQRLRSATRGDLVVCSTATQFGARSFAVSGPKAWNQLPAHLRALETVGSFKTALKTYLHSTL